MPREYKLHTPSPSPKPSRIDYRAELNAQQHAAVTAPLQSTSLVIAGAGSGKTRTLTYRVAWLLEQGIPAYQILLLTFTNKAAREMLDRAQTLLPFDARQLWGGTFHSIGARLLRRHAEALHFNQDFTIYDRSDSEGLLKSVIADAGINTKALRFPKEKPALDLFSLATNTQRRLEDLVAERYEWADEILDPLLAVRQEYEARKHEANAVDFDDLLELPVKLLQSQPELLQRYQQQFRFVLVDEYQDTNALQMQLIERLSGGGAQDGQGLMAVGDDAQSIYSWRGADAENILGFTKRYPHAKTFRIETNYRSSPEILALSNEVIAQNSRQLEKTLQADKPSGPLPNFLLLSDPSQQAHFLIQRIHELQDDGLELDQIAVLYRSHFHATELQLALTQANIPYQITSGARFFEQAHIKDVMAFLRFAANRRDEVAFKRMVLLLPGIGPKGADKLWANWLKEHEALQGRLPENFGEILGKLKVGKKAQEHWVQLGHIFDEFLDHGSEEIQLMPPAEMIRSVVAGIYEEIAQGQFANYENRLRELEQLEQMALESPSLSQFLEDSSLLAGADQAAAQESQADKNKPQLLLSSIHQAKGLEFPAVFVIWLAEGMFPTRRSLEAALEGDNSSLEEERRLFYVACTRAEKHLTLTYPAFWPNAWGGDPMQSPSRFLQDFSPEKVEQWQVS